jgi:hypothetical protein
LLVFKHAALSPPGTESVRYFSDELAPFRDGHREESHDEPRNPTRARIGVVALSQSIHDLACAACLARREGTRLTVAATGEIEL